MTRDEYLPALRFKALTPFFDGVVRTTMRERRFKTMLLDQATLEPGQRVLDLGCGTGTLALMATEREAKVNLTGLDDKVANWLGCRSPADKQAGEGTRK